MRSLAEHRDQYTPDEARKRLTAEVAQQSPQQAPPRATSHVHRYSELNFMCRCGKHGKVVFRK